nr:hypothetical protein Iba_chr10dCG14350 [Ipomoea batatas]
MLESEMEIYCYYGVPREITIEGIMANAWGTYMPWGEGPGVSGMVEKGEIDRILTIDMWRTMFEDQLKGHPIFTDLPAKAPRSTDLPRDPQIYRSTREGAGRPWVADWTGGLRRSGISVWFALREEGRSEGLKH